ncbi:MAG: UDP-N-acetylmuramate--L-alanine ligase [Candidatus Roizmanbacteria bacterium]
MLKQAKNIFFVGIKGVAMANLAVILKKMGKKVYGADVEEEFITDKLLKYNEITWQVGLKPEKLPKKIDLFVYSAAHGGLSNSIIVEAKKRKVNIISQSQLLGELMNEFETKISVTGCHGKTTTSSLLSYALNKLKAKPSYLVGVPFFTNHQGGDFQGKKYFVVEADEYGVNPPTDKTPKFFKLNPDWIICTNIDFDHPDVYKDIEETKKAFFKFFDNKKIILNIDNPYLFQYINTSKSRKIITYGFSENADYQITNWEINEEGSEFKIKKVGSFKISLFGKHNVSNATAVIVQLLQLGFKAEEIKKAIRDFTGAERRLELVYKKNNSYLFDDYAHHPTEITSTISALRDRFKNRKIIIIFQPHTYSRTAFLLKDFSNALSLADQTLLLPIFSSAREQESEFKITAEDIVKMSNNKNNRCFQNIIKLLSYLEKIFNKNDVIVTMGAGNVYKLKDEIIKIIDYGIWNLENNVDLFQYLTLKTHVVAEYFINARFREDLIKAKKFVINNRLPIFLFGGGSNVAITQKKIYGLVIRNSYLKKEIVRKGRDYVDLLVSSGYPVSRLINETVELGLSGFEYHKGLPGTVGGAIAMNSKWIRPLTYFSDNLLYAYLVDDKGRVKKVNKSYFRFSYDYSVLKDTREFVLEAVFRLKNEDKKLLQKRTEEVLEYRRRTQPQGVASSGCFFKNISKDIQISKKLPTTSAGYLIDKSELKGLSVGDYCVSKAHANFIINCGNGKSEDLMKLVGIIKKRVKKKFGVELEEEVIVI